MEATKALPPPDRSPAIASVERRRKAMTRFQLVFRENGRDRVETHDNNLDGEPQINGTLIVEGETYMIRGVEWLVTRDDIGDTKRFICTLVAELTDTG
jgi:hypothetical protein